MIRFGKRWVVGGLVAAAALAAGGTRASTARAARPNIVFILLDDAGYGDLSCYGQQKFETPNIDRLAAEGMRFTQHYSGSTVCAPTRCSLMTGLHTGHAFIRGNREVQPEGQWPIPAETLTMAEALRAAGYVTGAFGKWGLGPPGSEGDPLKQGFDEFCGYNCQRHAHNYYTDYLWHNAERIPLDGKTYSHDIIMEYALQFIRSNANRPFFCYLPVTIPHASLHVPEQYAAPFRKKFPEFEDVIGRYKGPVIHNPPACFAGMMTKIDEDVGRLTALLRELNLEDRTLVVLSSDNGPHREGGHRPEFFNSNGGLRGIKRDLYEGGIRAPLIARWPGKIRPGSVSQLICAQWDLLPTFCEVAGVAAPEGIDGLSILPTLLGRSERQRQHEYLYWEFPAQGGKQAARLGRWKGVRLGLTKNPDAPLELYDLASDPKETTNVADKHPDVAARMMDVFKEAHVDSELFPLFPR